MRTSVAPPITMRRRCSKNLQTFGLHASWPNSSMSSSNAVPLFLALMESDARPRDSRNNLNRGTTPSSRSHMDLRKAGASFVPLLPTLVAGGRFHRCQNCACLRLVKEFLMASLSTWSSAPSTLFFVVRGSVPKLQPSRNDTHTQCPHEWIRHTTLKFLHELPSKKFRNQPPQRISSGDAPDSAVGLARLSISRP